MIDLTFFIIIQRINILYRPSSIVFRVYGCVWETKYELLNESSSYKVRVRHSSSEIKINYLLYRVIKSDILINGQKYENY